MVYAEPLSLCTASTQSLYLLPDYSKLILMSTIINTFILQSNWVSRLHNTIQLRCVHLLAGVRSTCAWLRSVVLPFAFTIYIFQQCHVAFIRQNQWDSYFLAVGRCVNWKYSNLAPKMFLHTKIFNKNLMKHIGLLQPSPPPSPSSLLSTWD